MEPVNWGRAITAVIIASAAVVVIYLAFEAFSWAFEVVREFAHWITT